MRNKDKGKTHRGGPILRAKLLLGGLEKMEHGKQMASKFTCQHKTPMGQY